MRKIMLLPCLIAAVVAAMSLSASSAQAFEQYFCYGANVNNANKCWGASQEFETAVAWGNETGVCVGYDLTQGTCVPTFGLARVTNVPQGNQHSPWIIGTGSNFTHGYGELFP
jgi:hypothetical protein